MSSTAVVPQTMFVAEVVLPSGRRIAVQGAFPYETLADFRKDLVSSRTSTREADDENDRLLLSFLGGRIKDTPGGSGVVPGAIKRSRLLNFTLSDLNCPVCKGDEEVCENCNERELFCPCYGPERSMAKCKECCEDG